MSKKMKVRRVLIYEGEPNWIAKTLKHSLVQKDIPFQCSFGSIILESEEVILLAEGEDE